MPAPIIVTVASPSAVSAGRRPRRTLLVEWLWARLPADGARPRRRVGRRAQSRAEALAIGLGCDALVRTPRRRGWDRGV